MAVFSKELCSKKLNTWLAAEEAVATGQSYQIESRPETNPGANGILGGEAGRGRSR